MSYSTINPMYGNNTKKVSITFPTNTSRSEFIHKDTYKIKYGNNIKNLICIQDPNTMELYRVRVGGVHKQSSSINTSNGDLQKFTCKVNDTIYSYEGKELSYTSDLNPRIPINGDTITINLISESIKDYDNRYIAFYMQPYIKWLNSDSSNELVKTYEILENNLTDLGLQMYLDRFEDGTDATTGITLIRDAVHVKGKIDIPHNTTKHIKIKYTIANCSKNLIIDFKFTFK